MKKGTSIKMKILLITSSITAFIYIFWRLFFTIPTQHGMISLIVGLSLAIAETIGVIEAFSHYKSLSSINVQNYFQLISSYKIPMQKEKTLTQILV